MRDSSPRLRWVAVAMAAALTAVAGCTDKGGTPLGGPSSSAPNPGPSVPSLTEDQAFDRIPLDGTADVPLKWQLPQDGDAASMDAVLAARRFMALDYYRSSLDRPNTEAHLYRFVATQQMIDVLFPGGPKPDETNDPNRGPVWIWVLGVERSAPDGARVNVCLDIGYWHDSTKPDTQHRASRASLQSFEMKRVAENDAEPRWKVDKRWLPDSERLGPTYGSRCTAWANHTP